MKKIPKKKRKVTELYFNECDRITEIYTYNTKLKKRLTVYGTTPARHAAATARLNPAVQFSNRSCLAITCRLCSMLPVSHCAKSIS